MNDCFAVMDLGTNTFHLMIARVTDGHFTQIARDHEPVKLGEGGINKGFIQQNAFDRGLATMHRFSLQIKQYNIQRVKAIATSALRSAKNGQAFIDNVKEQTGIEIEIIDGLQEATYIYQGVKASGALTDDKALIMDIGGGSVEFIICTNNTMLWKQSFEIGAARLIERFHQVDPIPHQSITALHNYLGESLQPLFEAAQGITVNKLIGSAGAFETFAEVIELETQPAFDVKDIKTYNFDIDHLVRITDVLIASSNKQRQAMKGIISLRVDMIVAASIITRYVMQKLDIKQVSMSTYSLKEGVMAGLAQ
ncbi:exopolyphosphatase/guanosine-5'-triphosphate,3'-diphosphate pyrophosphatase [Mucilaginibacter gracilis]|uniref:Exopolyphosphatase/guanosine-5'-triphosphate, 3'-diphosphate pyrophosphatase n=1 Tax=Mucilaginibacter gracilis TaxID=423350 RepID=A0A495J241_9SPHI|nr:exopolyphosphatase [Mucilaginibacter gracilis]RKR82711.1 exopolyphosphatase/guanosine-5'-triphosphate,3'-diphosphate pyrophosphatase [Mucilaginibacter gracilis]